MRLNYFSCFCCSYVEFTNQNTTGKSSTKNVFPKISNISLPTFQNWSYIAACLRIKKACSKLALFILECCHNLAPLADVYHLLEFSNEVLYDLVPKGVIKNMTGQG